MGLCAEFEARRPARESREAAVKMGHRFAELFNALSSARLRLDLPYPIAFGAAGAVLGIDEESITLASLQQSVKGLISACQRLMPLGQVAASCVLWNLRPVILEGALASERQKISCFTLLPDIGSIRHSSLESRLFIS